LNARVQGAHGMKYEDFLLKQPKESPDDRECSEFVIQAVEEIIPEWNVFPTI